MSHIERRRSLRDLSRNDPMKPVEASKFEADGTIQVGDDLKSEEPADMNYQDDKFANVIKVTTLVADDEKIRPDLDVGADKLALHRKLLKDLAAAERSPIG